MRWALLGVWVWTLAALSARADEGVLLREGGAPRPGLCAALRIQLSGIAPVQCEEEPSPVPLSERLAATAARLRAQGARLGVLLERDPNPGLIRVYIVAAREDQAVLAIERIADRPDPDIDRSLALKVSDAYEVMGIVRAAAPERALPVAAALPGPASTPPARWAPLLEVGAGPHLEPAAGRWLANALLGVGVGRSALRLEVAAGARLDSEADAEGESGRVRMRERAGLLSLRLLWRTGRVELGTVLEAVFARITGAADASDRHAERQFFSPVLGVGAELRLRLFGSAFLRLAPTLEVLHRERLAIAGTTVLDTGPLRAALPLSLLVHLPR